MLRSAVICVALLLGAAAPAPAPDLAGTYVRTKPSGGALKVQRAGDDWRIHLIAGGLPRGGGTAADCEAELIGPLRGQTIHARAAPFQAEDNEITAEDLAQQPASVDLEVIGGGLKVVRSDVEQHCGLGSDVRGAYLRSPRSRR